jgi:hypothetical protein
VSTVSPGWLARGSVVVDRILQAAALAIAASVLFAGWHDASHGYDIWYYHLPFAARLVGLIDPATYAFSGDNAARYSGFPLLAELLQGIVWRVSGRIEATNLVSVGALLAIPVVLRRLWGIALHTSLLALLAIPLVQIHATSSYVDLPANASVTVLLLCVWRVAASPTSATERRVLALALAAAAAAVNTKFQVVPVVAGGVAVLIAFVVRRRELKRHGVVLLVALPLILATPLKNVVVHGNPVWPVEIALLGRSLPHREKAYAQSPPHLADTPRPIRFVRSVLEVDNKPIASRRRWSLDQWAPADDPSCRMGGYFGIYALVNVFALAWAVARRRDRETRAALFLFGGVTAVAALVPQCHELRYYMHWMMLLVAMNVVLWAPRRVACGLVAAAALAVVGWSTSLGYLYASGISFAELRTRHVDRGVIEQASPGERLCIAREPFTFLHAPLFDRRKDYAVQEATGPEDCGDAPLVR